jgi:glycosyltransferase involved in cell wall biosynthesis
MANEPVVSVVLPVRDAVATLQGALNSIVTQTFGHFELIVVDDGSTDGSAHVLTQARERDSRIRVVSNPGRGLTVAINHGVSLAQGRFIARQDADDVSMPDRLERQVECLSRREDVCAVGTATVIIDGAGEALGDFPVRIGAAAVRAGLTSARATPVHGSMMIRRESLAAVGGYRQAFLAAQDFDLWLRLLERSDIDNIDEPLYRWRLASGSVYGAKREMQVMYAGIALAFARERAQHGEDSCAALEEAGGDLETFARHYRLRGLLRSLWGELLFRAVGAPRVANRHLRLALRHGDVRLPTLLLWGWTWCGLPWIGGRPLRVPDSTNQCEGEARS